MNTAKYFKASDIDDAVKALRLANDGQFLAGGMTLIPTLKQRLANPNCLIDLSDCGLSSIDNEGIGIWIGLGR
jgi:carbon-monoxide dehydrogenase medium subunit